MNFTGKWKYCLIVSGSIMAIALLMTLVGFGMNMGIDFSGGTIIEYNMGEVFNVSDIEEAMNSLGVTERQINQTGEGDVKDRAIIRVRELGSTEEEMQFRTGLENSLREKYQGIAFVTSDYVGAVAGRSLVYNAIQAVLFATALMLVYIAFRFDLFSGLAAVLGLLHDVLIMVSFMVILRSVVQVNSTFIAAMLTIVGYSINNTIVIFDRIRENFAKPSFRSKPRLEIVNVSINDSLMRTINTTLTTLLTIVTLYILGVDSIREFALPLIIGMLSGIYSAVMINGTTWAKLLDWNASRKQQKKYTSTAKPKKQPQ